MIIISHRGYWKDYSEKNTVRAFERSFSMGFGTETDVRDCAGELVISHDMPNSGELTLDAFLSLYKHYQGVMPLALNVKCDGLQSSVKDILKKYEIDDYFMFDMSIPDMLGYLNLGLNTFVRYSEYEGPSALWDRADGLWLDGFESLCLDVSLIEKFISQNKRVCIVSPELHKRSTDSEWEAIKQLPAHLLNSDKLILCTDIPEIAKDYFLS
ncbi:MAG: glycerophosphoryl diester phosphodiesterase [Psychromonas sp.]|jgi:glycerophosphoryl diester phosphodiesterase